MRRRITLAVLAAPLFLYAEAGAQSVSLMPISAHPTQVLKVTGTGFTDSEAVDVYLDTTDTLLLVSSSTGALSGSMTIPATTPPGAHAVTAIGRRSGDAAQASVTVTTPWFQDGFGNARLSLNPYENVLNQNNVSTLGPLWAASDNPTGGTPAVTSVSVFVPTSAGIQRLATATGAPVWTSAKSDTFYAGPLLSGTTIYAASFNGTLYALSNATGAALWTASVGTTYSTPALANGILYVGNTSGEVLAINASTGKTVWTYMTGAEIDSSATVVNGVVYVGSNNDNLYALNAANGSVLWTYQTGSAIECTPSVANGVAYVGSDDGYVYAVRAVGAPAVGEPAGSLIWKSSVSGAVFGHLAVSGTYVYAPSTSGSLYALDTRTGEENWSFATDSYSRSPIVANGVVYFTSNSGALYALDAYYGEELLFGQSGNAYIGGPAVSDGVLYVAGESTAITAYALSAGTSVVKRTPPAIASLHPDFRLQVSH